MSTNIDSINEVYIASGARTAIGSFGGALVTKSTVELGSIVISEALKRGNIDKALVDEVIMGCVLTAGQGQNPARLAAIKAQIPQEICSYTVNMVCGSGLKAVMEGAKTIKSGDAQIVVAGGMENMSMAPYLLPNSRWGYRMGHQNAMDMVIQDGLWCGIEDIHMGITAENVSEQYHVSREEQDKFALNSQEKASRAQESGRFDDEIVPVEVKTKKETYLFSKDEYIKKGTSLDKLSNLRPAFKKEGTVTAGNASGINDGAAAVVLISGEMVNKLGIKPLAKITAYTQEGIDPKIMGMGPMQAIKKVLGKAGLSIEDIDLYEINEAFSAQSVAVVKELGLDPDKVNVNGGAIALGHPIGASGTRILVSLLYEMEKQNAKNGIASLCIGGGMGVAVLVERSV